MQNEQFDTVRAIIWDDGVLKLLDQRRLPQITEYIACKDVDSVANAIKSCVPDKMKPIIADIPSFSSPFPQTLDTLLMLLGRDVDGSRLPPNPTF